MAYNFKLKALSSKQHKRRKLTCLVAYVIVIVLFFSYKILTLTYRIGTQLDCYKPFDYPIMGDIKQYVDQMKKGLKPDVSPVNKHNYVIKLWNKSKCADAVTLDMIYIVKSAVGCGNLGGRCS